MPVAFFVYLNVLLVKNGQYQVMKMENLSPKVAFHRLYTTEQLVSGCQEMLSRKIGFVVK